MIAHRFLREGLLAVYDYHHPNADLNAPTFVLTTSGRAALAACRKR